MFNRQKGIGYFSSALLRKGHGEKYFTLYTKVVMNMKVMKTIESKTENIQT